MKKNFTNPSLLSMAKMKNQGVNAESNLNQNRRLILSIINDLGVASRKELAYRTNLKPATITIAINDFLDAGIIEKAGFRSGDSGRKVMGFRLARNKYCAISIRLNVSYISIGVYDIHKKNLFIKKMFMDTLKDIRKTCDIIAQEIDAVKPIIGKLEVLGVGVAVEGPFIIKDGYYQLPDPESETGYFDLGKTLNEKIEYPIIINRENNFSVYCLWKEEFKKYQLAIIVIIMISYEVECGIMINGEIINGRNGSAGLLGKVFLNCDDQGNKTKFADRVSTKALLKRTLELLDQYPDSVLVSKKDDLNIRDVIMAFFDHDELAVRVYTEAAKQIGFMIANITHVLNPDLILISDEIPLNKEMEKIIIEETKLHVSPEILPLIRLPINRVERFTKDDPSLLGACYYIIDAFIETSTSITKK